MNLAARGLDVRVDQPIETETATTLEDEDAPRTNGHEVSEPAGEPQDFELLMSTYTQQQEDLQLQIDALRREQLEVTERVVRGRASQADLAKVRRRVRALEDELADVVALERVAFDLARQREAAERVHEYYATLDIVSSSFQEACSFASRIDALLETLGEEVSRCHTALQEWNSLVRVANRQKVRGLADGVTSVLHQGGLQEAVRRRLIGLDVLPNDIGLYGEERQRLVTPIVQSWTASVLRIARQVGPALNADSGAS